MPEVGQEQTQKQSPVKQVEVDNKTSKQSKKGSDRGQNLMAKTNNNQENKLGSCFKWILGRQTGSMEPWLVDILIGEVETGMKRSTNCICFLSISTGIGETLGIL